MNDPNAKPGVVVVHSKLKTDEFNHLDIRVPTSLAIISPSATDEELRGVGIEPLAPGESQHLKEKVVAELTNPSKIHVVDEAHSWSRGGKG